MDETNFYRLYPLVSCVLSLVMAGILWPHRGNPSARYVMWNLLAVALWSLGYTFEYQVPDLESKLGWVNLEYVGVVSTPPLFLAFSLSLGNLGHLITRGRAALVILIPALVLVGVWTNPWHHFMWDLAWLDFSRRMPLVVYARSWGFWVLVVYSYLLLALGTAILAWSYWRSQDLQRKRLRIVLVGVAAPWLSNALYVAAQGTGPHLDPTPLAFTVSGLCFTWGLFRYQLLDIMPLARRFVMESMTDPVLVFNLDGRLTDLNSAARRLWGEDWEALLGLGEREVFPQLTPLWDRASSHPWRGQVVMEHWDPPRTFDLRVSRLRDRWLGVVGGLVILRDVTARERAARALRDSAERHRRFLEHLPDPVMVYDMHGQVVYLNPAFAKTFGWSREDLSAGRTDFVPPHTKAATLAALARMLRHEPIRDFHTQRRTADGRLLEVHVNTEPFHDAHGAQVGNIVLLRDVTALKEYQDDLRRSERRGRAILEAAADPIVVCDTEGRVVFLNPAHEKAFGWTLDQCQGQKMERFAPHEFRDQAQAMLEEMTRGGSFTGMESWGLTKGGEKIPVSISGAVFTDDQGRPEGSVICLRDQRRTKELEAQLLQAQKMEAIGTLAGGVAHEFNNILMAITGYTQLLAQRPDLDPAVRDYLDKIEQSSARAADLTGNMLSISRPKTGAREPVKVEHLLERMRRLVRQTFPPDLRVEVDLAPDLPLVMANPNQLEQVLLNLALNARDAMPEGGRLSFAAGLSQADEEFCLTHPWALPGPYLELRVSDTGEGMPPQVLEHIFEPFFSTKEPGKGTGLGLSVVYSVIANHQGGILVDSHPGRGTRFAIYLPAQARAARGQALPGPSRPLPQGQGQRVLVVDDEEPVREIVGFALQEAGYQPDYAGDGAVALDLFRAARQERRPFGLVIMDLSMPVMDGRQCTRRLLEMDAGARIIIATGHLDSSRQATGLDPRIRGVLRKPYDLDSLLQMVGSSLT